MTLSTREHQVTRLVLTTAPLAPLLMVKMSEARVKVFTGHETRRQGDSISSSSTTNGLERSETDRYGQTAEHTSLLSSIIYIYAL